MLLNITFKDEINSREATRHFRLEEEFNIDNFEDIINTDYIMSVISPFKDYMTTSSIVFFEIKRGNNIMCDAPLFINKSLDDDAKILALSIGLKYAVMSAYCKLVLYRI